MNRLNRLASSSEAEPRIAARREPDAVLRVLAAARWDCLAHDHHDGAAQIGRLRRGFEVARTRIADGGLPHPANARVQSALDNLEITLNRRKAAT